jgi:hypothetical protein
MIDYNINKLNLIIFVFLLLFISGCKEISYREQVPYQVEETYYVDEPYYVDVPYTVTEEYEVNESYQAPIQLDLSGNEIKALEVVEHRNSLEGDTCTGESDIYNPNNAKIYFDIEYVLDLSIANDKSHKYNQSVDKFDTYTLEASGKKPYWLSDCGGGNLIESEQITILNSPDINNTFKTEWHIVTKQREVTKYKKEIRTRKIPQTRTVTKYQERLVTEKKLLWQ